MIYIGIDPGVNTGFAVWDSGRKKIVELTTCTIVTAMDRVKEIAKDNPVTLVIEDARKRTWYGCNSEAKKQGAGSVKRDCMVWEEFVTINDIPSQFLQPMRGGTKLSQEYFKFVTGWKGRTSNHARDAAMLVFGK